MAVIDPTLLAGYVSRLHARKTEAVNVMNLYLQNSEELATCGALTGQAGRANTQLAFDVNHAIGEINRRFEDVANLLWNTIGNFDGLDRNNATQIGLTAGNLRHF